MRFASHDVVAGLNLPTLIITEESPLTGLGTKPITKFDRKGVYNRLVKGFFEERAKVIVMSIGQVTATGVDNE